MKWSKKWPKKAGNYWFYGYRYGKESCGTPNDPELVFMKVRKISNGFMLIGNGQFMYESEVEEPHFQKAILPELPHLKQKEANVKTESTYMGDQLTEFELSVCIIYAKYHPFSIIDIRVAFKRLRSFDKLLFALRLASMFNISLFKAVEICIL